MMIGLNIIKGGLIVLATIVVKYFLVALIQVPALEPLLYLVSCLIVIEISKRLFKSQFSVRNHNCKIDPKIVLPSLIIIISINLLGQFLSEYEQYLRLGFKDYSSLFNNSLGGGSSDPIDILLFTPIAEEILWRGFLLFYFFKETSITKSIVITSTIFAVFHIKQDHVNMISLIISSMTLSIFLSFLMLKVNNLKFMIILHAIYNMLWYLYLLVIVVSGISFRDNIDFYFFEFGLLTLIIPLSFFGWKFLRRLLSHENPYTTL